MKLFIIIIVRVIIVKSIVQISISEVLLKSC